MTSSSSMHHETKRPRRRRRVGDAAARDASPWGSLHEDLTSLVAWRVLAGDLRDYVRFRAVCHRWRCSTACPRGRGIVDPRFHPRRWMMLPEGHGLHPGHGKLGGCVRFFNLSTGAFVRVRLPLFRDHCILDSVDGILVLQRDHDTAIRLLHPFTGDIAEFPPLETLLPYVSPWLLGLGVGDKWKYLRNIQAACINVGADGVVSVMMLLSGMQNLSFATSGDQEWRVSSWWLEPDKCSVPLAFQGKLYMLHRPEGYRGVTEVLQVDPPQQEDMELGSPSLPPPKLIAKYPAITQSVNVLQDLAECNSEILVIVSRLGEDKQYSVYRLADLMLERTVPLTGIHGSSLFFCSARRSLFVSFEAFPTIMADTIVLFEFRENYLAQYHLNSGTLSAASDSCTPGAPILSPYTIINHIFTCCFRDYWNKGYIFGQKKHKRWRVKRKWRDGA